MRTAFMGLLGLAGSLACGTGASALPAAPPRAALTGDVLPVQLRCDRLRCWDPRSGAYTGSRCDYRGCRPNTGVLGYLDSPPSQPQDYGWRGRRAYDDDYDARPRYRHRWREDWGN